MVRLPHAAADPVADRGAGQRPPRPPGAPPPSARLVLTRPLPSPPKVKAGQGHGHRQQQAHQQGDGDEEGEEAVDEDFTWVLFERTQRVLGFTLPAYQMMHVKA